jgi:putative flippase GtrA
MNMREIIRYLLIGGACAASQNAIIIALSWIGHSYLLANLASAILFVPLGYLLHSIFTFRVTPSGKGLRHFAGGQIAGIPLSSVLLWLTHGICRIPIHLASPFVTALMALYGFMMARWISRLWVAPSSYRRPQVASLRD